jgi:chaperonin cofactor prefoldin
MLESSQQIKISEFQIEQLRSTITRARLTEKELDGLPPETRTYEAVGRMYEIIIVF